MIVDFINETYLIDLASTPTLFSTQSIKCLQPNELEFRLNAFRRDT